MNIINVIYGYAGSAELPTALFYFIKKIYSGKFGLGKSEKHIIKSVWPYYNYTMEVYIFVISVTIYLDAITSSIFFTCIY